MFTLTFKSLNLVTKLLFISEKTQKLKKLINNEVLIRAEEKWSEILLKNKYAEGGHLFRT